MTAFSDTSTQASTICLSSAIVKLESLAVFFVTKGWRGSADRLVIAGSVGGALLSYDNVAGEGASGETIEDAGECSKVEERDPEIVFARSLIASMVLVVLFSKEVPFLDRLSTKLYNWIRFLP